MKKVKIFSVLVLSLLSGVVLGHHYKGLPHFSYFENYPQIPYLEFIHEEKDFEIYMTVYNFQGLNLEQVDSPDDVRLYIYIFDILSNRVFKRPARFQILSHGNLVHDTGVIPSEQENIFVIQRPIEEQDDLLLKVSFKDGQDKQIEVSLPFQITKTFFQRFGVFLVIGLFFLVVIGMKLVTNRLKARGSVVKERQ